jgi:hypothetical protein
MHYALIKSTDQILQFILVMCLAILMNSDFAYTYNSDDIEYNQQFIFLNL